MKTNNLIFRGWLIDRSLLFNQMLCKNYSGAVRCTFGTGWNFPLTWQHQIFRNFDTWYGKPKSKCTITRAESEKEPFNVGPVKHSVLMQSNQLHWQYFNIRHKKTMPIASNGVLIFNKDNTSMKRLQSSKYPSFASHEYENPASIMTEQRAYTKHWAAMYSSTEQWAKSNQ